MIIIKVSFYITFFFFFFNYFLSTTCFYFLGQSGLGQKASGRLLPGPFIASWHFFLFQFQFQFQSILISVRLFRANMTGIGWLPALFGPLDLTTAAVTFSSTTLCPQRFFSRLMFRLFGEALYLLHICLRFRWISRCCIQSKIPSFKVILL